MLNDERILNLASKDKSNKGCSKKVSRFQSRVIPTIIARNDFTLDRFLLLLLLQATQVPLGAACGGASTGGSSRPTPRMKSSMVLAGALRTSSSDGSGPYACTVGWSILEKLVEFIGQRRNSCRYYDAWMCAKLCSNWIIYPIPQSDQSFPYANNLTGVR